MKKIILMMLFFTIYGLINGSEDIKEGVYIGKGNKKIMIDSRLMKDKKRIHYLLGVYDYSHGILFEGLERNKKIKKGESVLVKMYEGHYGDNELNYDSSCKFLMYVSENDKLNVSTSDCHYTNERYEGEYNLF